MNTQRNTKGQYQSKGMNDIYRHLIIAGILSLGMFAFFGIRADARAADWQANAQLNASVHQNAALTLTATQLNTLQNKDAALR